MEAYSEILDRMKAKYEELTGITPSDTSDIGVKLQVLAGEIYSAMVNAQWIFRQMFPATATGEYLDYHAGERGLSRRQASFSEGEVIFSVSEATATELVIPAGTVVSTKGNEPLLFETTEEGTIATGTTAVHIPVKAMHSGSAYNVGAGKILLMVTPPAGVESVTNPDPCTSGTDVENDEYLRERIEESLRFAPSGANCAYYKKIAMETDGVQSAGVVPRARGTGTVDVYVAGEGTEVSKETIAQVQDVLSLLREVNVDVLVKPATPSYISMALNIELKDGYDFDSVREKCIQALKEYIISRGVGGNVLLTEAGERIYHIDGVKEYNFPAASNSIVRCSDSTYPLPYSIKVYEGVA